MPDDFNPANEVEINVDDLFNDDFDPTPEPPEKSDPLPGTKAVSQRINEVRAKTEKATREAIAKDFGYESYEAMQKAKEKNIIKEAGLDEASVESVVSKLVEQRLAADPRIQRLAEYEEREKSRFVSSQLAEINKATGQDFKTLDQLPKETIEMWQKTGNLKQAYFATQGEALLLGRMAKADMGSTRHLATGGQNGGGATQRGLTASEKQLWRMVMPDITDEELSKKTVDI